ncbi:hypothetical protein ABBQ38_012941 [Trebouxia sp. C0009 RCD-2024]
MEACDFKRLVKEKFDARTTYDEGAERHPKLAAELVRRTQLQDGWKVLDLACGTGLVTYMASKFVGSDGFVEGVDISPSMIRQAAAKLEASTCSNVSFQVGDLEKCSYTKQSFDAVLCSSAIFYVDLKSFGVTLHSWLKPGGVLAYNSLQEPYTPLLPLMSRLLAKRGFTDYHPDKPLSQTHSEEANANTLQAAGFERVQVDTTIGLLFERPMQLSEYATKGGPSTTAVRVLCGSIFARAVYVKHRGAGGGQTL